MSRLDRAEIWQLAERFPQQLDAKGLETRCQVAEHASQLETVRCHEIEERRRTGGRAQDRATFMRNPGQAPGGATATGTLPWTN